MKVRMKQAILALFLISNSGSLFAALVDGNKLSEWNNNQDQAGFESGLFEGYVAGVVDVGNNPIFALHLTSRESSLMLLLQSS